MIIASVVIGANAAIYPGVRLGRGSIVEPFALLKESLGELGFGWRDLALVHILRCPRFPTEKEVDAIAGQGSDL